MAKDTHAVLTGKYTGTVELEDGRVIDATDPIIYVDSVETAEEIGFIIGEHWVEHGHPDDIELVDDMDDPDNGNLVQRPFYHTEHADKRFAKHPKKFQGETRGTPSKAQREMHPKTFGKKG